MKTYNEKCPFCGHLNKNLYLEETNGWMECEKCHQDTRVLYRSSDIKLPVFTGMELIRKIRPAGI